MIGVCHHRAAAGGVDRGSDILGIGRHHHRAERGGLRPREHVSDHGAASDVGERLAGQAARRKAGGDEDDDVAFHR